jgi:hypothetical protein
MKHLIPFITLAILSSPVLAEQVTPGNMPAYCRGMAASDFGTKPAYIKTGKLKKNKDGSYTISGTYDGKDPFTCAFAKSGEYTGLTRGAAKHSSKAPASGPSNAAINACDMFMKGEKGHVEGFNDLGNGLFSVTLKYKSGFKHCEVTNEPRVDKFEDL